MARLRGIPTVVITSDHSDGWIDSDNQKVQGFMGVPDYVLRNSQAVIDALRELRGSLIVEATTLEVGMKTACNAVGLPVPRETPGTTIMPVSEHLQAEAA